jgi:membrane protein
VRGRSASGVGPVGEEPRGGLGGGEPERRGGRVAATVTFYCVLALFPFLLFVVGVLSKVVSWETIEDIVRQVSRVMPRDVTNIVSERLFALKSQPATGLLTVSFLGALWSASSGVASLIPALDRAYDVVETRPFWKRRLLAIAITLGVGLLSIVASLTAIAVPALAQWTGGPLGAALSWLRLPLAGVLIMATWTGLYQLLPDMKPHFQPVTPGSVVGVLVWIVASWGFSLYVQHFGRFEATYGALGGVIVLLLWMWVSTMALLLGAEINRILMPKARSWRGAGAGRAWGWRRRARRSRRRPQPGAPMGDTRSDRAG